MRPTGSQDFLQQRRYEAIGLLNKGFPPVEVARRLGVDRRSVRRWKAMMRRQGSRGLQAKRIPGRPAKLNPRQKEKLQSHLLRGAQAWGFPTDLWTCPRITRLIQRSFGVHYHVDHTSRLLRSLGWSPQKPERRARERDERAIRTWVRSQWPRLKKKPES